MKEFHPNINPFFIGMTKKEITVLLFWATIGIAKAKSGSYLEVAPKLIKYLSKELKIKLPYKPEFNSRIKEYKRRSKKLPDNPKQV